MNIVSSTVVAPKDLTPAHISRLFSLMHAVYGGCTPKKCSRDLRDKDHVLLFFDAAGTIQGFTTAAVFDFLHGDTTVTILFSGDTVIAEAARGSLVLMREWWKLVCTVRARQPERECYWLLISKGWRTYKMCPLFFKQFYPSQREPTPPAMHAFMEALARARFGVQYQNGLVLPPEPDYLRSGLEDVPQRKVQDPDVRFFVQHNPHFYLGHELVCLCRLHPDNLTDMAMRHFHKAESC